MRRNFTTSLQRFAAVLLLVFLVSTAYSQSSGTKPSTHKLLLRDEGLSQLSYVDMADSQKNWYKPIPAGRDLQLVGRGRVLIGTETGYEERSIATGEKVFALSSFKGTIAARRLRNGNTLLTGLNWLAKQGIVLLEVDTAGAIHHVMNFPAFNYVRLVRETPTGTYLVTADSVVFESTQTGNILWQVKVFGIDKAHVWQAVRITNGKTIISCGFVPRFQIADENGRIISAITGPDSLRPHFYAGFQILSNGNIVVTNWQGHGPNFGAIGTQLFEYSPTHDIVWTFHQDPKKYSSLQGVIVLDGLDLNFLHVEDADGKLAPVK